MKTDNQIKWMLFRYYWKFGDIDKKSELYPEIDKADIYRFDDEVFFSAGEVRDKFRIVGDELEFLEEFDWSELNNDDEYSDYKNEEVKSLNNN